MKYDLINFIEIDFIYLNISPLQSILFGDLINQCPTHPNKIRLCNEPSHENQPFKWSFSIIRSRDGFFLGLLPNLLVHHHCPYQIAGYFFGVYQPHVQTQII